MDRDELRRTTARAAARLAFIQRKATDTVALTMSELETLIWAALTSSETSFDDDQTELIRLSGLEALKACELYFRNQVTYPCAEEDEEMNGSLLVMAHEIERYIGTVYKH
jgi:hypothetical protein